MQSLLYSKYPITPEIRFAPNLSSLVTSSRPYILIKEDEVVGKASSGRR